MTDHLPISFDPDERGECSCSACGWTGHEREILRAAPIYDQEPDAYCPKCKRPAVVVLKGYRSWERR